MTLSSIPLFRLIHERLSWLGARERVISQNVANSDTPGYRPVDLAPQRFDEALGAALAPVRSDPRHLAPPGMDGRIETRKATHPLKLSGNAVDLESELMKASDTAAQHALVTSLYRKQLGFIAIALGRGGEV